MTNTRAARLGAAMAVAWLIVLTVLDLVAPPNISPDPLFAIAPLAAAAVMSARVTAGFATATVALVALSGLYNDRWTTTQQWLRLLNVVLVGAAAVVTLAVVRISGASVVPSDAAPSPRPPSAPSCRPCPTRSPVCVLSPRATSPLREDALVGGDLYDCSHVRRGAIRFAGRGRPRQGHRRPSSRRPG